MSCEECKHDSGHGCELGLTFMEGFEWLSLKKTMMNNCETCRHLVYFCGAHGCLMNRDVDFRLDRLCQDYDEAEW